MREPRADLGEFVDQFRRRLGDALHVAAIPRVQHPPRHLGADAPTVFYHLGPLAEHFTRDREFLVHDGRGALLAR